MGNFHGEEKEGEIFALKYRGRPVFVASVSRRLMTERRPMSVAVSQAAIALSGSDSCASRNARSLACHLVLGTVHRVTKS